MKYARIERERRFLLPRVPREVDLAKPWSEIHDRYIVGTRLRLREVRPSDGGASVFKLTQKLPDTDATRVRITNTYLEAHEHALLCAHPANEIRKRRHRLVHDGSAFVIDRFLAELDGLVLSEVGAETDDALAAIPFPSFAALEVTEREEFMGGALADAAPDDVLTLARKLIGGPG